MAISVLSDNAPEEGTFVITVVLTDEDGNALTPDTLSWSLFDVSGNVINSRSSVSISSPASSNDIVLQGDDLAVTGSNVKRRLTLVGTYDSTYGNDLPLTAECAFKVDQFVGVS